MDRFWIVVAAILFIFLTTVIGAALVFCKNRKETTYLNPIFSGTAAGIMISASIWSLLLPALEVANSIMGRWAFLPATIGIVLGGVFIALLDFLPIFKAEYQANGLDRRRAIKLFLAVTLHNIPEGIAVGFALGAAFSNEIINYAAAIGLVIGIGLQNMPEGAAVALPMNNLFSNRNKAFLFGAASGAVEAIFAFLGYFLTAYLQFIHLWLPAFAAGAMLYVVIDELLPEVKMKNKIQYGIWSVIFGFVLMMVLDIIFA